MSEAPLKARGGGASEEEEEEFVAYPIRWLMLFCFSIASFANAFVWISFGGHSRLLGDAVACS
jgi:hypothetical protein